MRVAGIGVSLPLPTLTAIGEEGDGDLKAKLNMCQRFYTSTDRRARSRENLTKLLGKGYSTTN